MSDHIPDTSASDHEEAGDLPPEKQIQELGIWIEPPAEYLVRGMAADLHREAAPEDQRPAAIIGNRDNKRCCNSIHNGPNILRWDADPDCLQREMQRERRP